MFPKYLRCPECFGEITVTAVKSKFTDKYAEISVKCGNYNCPGEWDKNGDPIYFITVPVQISTT